MQTIKYLHQIKNEKNKHLDRKVQKTEIVDQKTTNKPPNQKR